LAPAAVAALAAAADGPGASFADSTALWAGSMHIRVACAAGGADCGGDLAIYAPGDHAHSLTGASFKVAAGMAATVRIDTTGERMQKRIDGLKSIFARIDPRPPGSGQPVEATLTIVRRAKVPPKRPPTKRPPKLPPTKRQVVPDKRGDSRIAGLDLVRTSATRKGKIVVFQVVNASPLRQHDGFGNPITPCIEFPWPKSLGGPQRHPMQMCGDGALRGYTMRYWPKIAHTVSGKTVTWKVPLKLLPKSSFRWRAYCAEADHVRDAAPNKGYMTFVR
jgi:hypothetical protein